MDDVQHAWNTWRKPSGDDGRLWLRDDLPKHMPEARIFLYEYNSRLIYGGDKSRFVDKANDLLEALRGERKKVCASVHFEVESIIIHYHLGCQ